MKILVIGAGPAGLMAAYAARKNGAEVIVYEKMERVLRKLLITGKGRCNLTNAAPIDQFIENTIGNPNFLYSAFYTFTNEQVMEFFRDQGLALKVERGNRVFPESDKSTSVADALLKACIDLGIKVRTRSPIQTLWIEDGILRGAEDQKGNRIPADRVILATGGKSYPATGSTGDGYHMAKAYDHTIVQPLPALVAFRTEDSWNPNLAGLSLKNISLITKAKKKKEYFGDLLFTHDGISGPVVLTAGRYLIQEGVVRENGEFTNTEFWIDLKPALSKEKLDRRILRDFQAFHLKQLKTVLKELLPQALIPIVIEKSGLDPEMAVHQVNKKQREALVQTLKFLPIQGRGLKGFKEAIITVGGVSVKDVDPSTMASKKVEGLYFAGEVLDVDALTGGFNLQIAFSTGYLAGMSASEEQS
ncbi:NAD(P)/FAD-dependent oxidoreductase [Gottschalkiaceae bacterium SANA]|nr:NAD(P)/FAD-dependent oxidoreductase [Gottschalkiaceae bacterium SANA]